MRRRRAHTLKPRVFGRSLMSRAVPFRTATHSQQSVPILGLHVLKLGACQFIHLCSLAQFDSSQHPPCEQGGFHGEVVTNEGEWAAASESCGCLFQDTSTWQFQSAEGVKFQDTSDMFTIGWGSALENCRGKCAIKLQGEVWRRQRRGPVTGEHWNAVSSLHACPVLVSLPPSQAL